MFGIPTVYIAVVAFFTFLYYVRSQKPIRKETFDDDFGNPSEFISPKNTGLWIGNGRITQERSFLHCGLVASSGGFKTSGFLLNSALTLDNVSIVCLDPAGELLSKAGPELAAKGFSLVVFDPENAERSVSFNPLERANSSTELSMLADAIFAQTQSQSTDLFWSQSGARLLVLLFRLQKKLPKEQQHLPNTLYLLTLLEGDLKQVDLLFSMFGDDDRLFADYKAFIALDRKLSSSIISSCMAVLRIFSDENIARVCATDTIAFETLRTKKQAVFLQINVLTSRYYAFILEILCSQMFTALMSHIPSEKELPVFFLLDEAGSIKIPGLAEALANFRKYAVSITYAVQGISQLVEIHGRENANTIIKNTHNLIHCGGMDVATAKDLETRLGRYTFENEEGKRESRQLMTASELIHLPEDTALYLAGSAPAMLIPICPYFKNQKLLKKTQQLLPPIVGTAPQTVPYISIPKASRLHVAS